MWIDVPMDQPTSVYVADATSGSAAKQVPGENIHSSQHDIASADQATTSQKTEAQHPKAIGVCLAADYRDTESDNHDLDYFNPARAYRSYFIQFENIQIPKTFSPDIVLEEAPAHGKIVETKENNIINRAYVSNAGYLGDDKIIYKVSFQGETVTVIYFFKVTHNLVGANETANIVCGKKNFWKISD